MAGAWFTHRPVRPVHGLYRPLLNAQKGINHSTTITVLRTFFRDHPGEPVPEENFWTLWCKGRLIEADTSTIRLGATPSGLTSAHLHHTPIFTGWMPFLPPNQQYQSTEGTQCIRIREKMIEFFSKGLLAPSLCGLNAEFYNALKSVTKSVTAVCSALVMFHIAL